jgi:hypothetical protein
MILINFRLLSIQLGNFLGFLEKLRRWDKFYTYLDKTFKSEFDCIRKKVNQNLTQPLFVKINEFIYIFTNVNYFS